jgi:tetratricopeptide (TPR) repeat protein
LANFRSNWKNELVVKTNPITSTTNNKSKNSTEIETGYLKPRPSMPSVDNTINEEKDLVYEQPQNDEQKAQYLFNKALTLEQQNRYLEAVQFYKLAFQLDPEVEFKSYKLHLSTNSVSIDKVSQNNSNIIDKMSDLTLKKDKSEENNLNLTLYQQFEASLLSNNNNLCKKMFPQRSSTVHFSELPTEVVLSILKWVISDHLDMRSLEMFSNVIKL